MQRLNDDIINFFRDQSFAIVSTIDEKGFPNNSCKGIVRIDKDGKVFLMDLYRGATFRNLAKDVHIAVTGVDEYKFKGYCLKGTAKIIPAEIWDEGVIKAWELRISQRITQRVIKNIVGEKGHPRHPEAMLPQPAHLIEMEVSEIVDLTPHHIKQGV